jgi:hypothetical protein
MILLKIKKIKKLIIMCKEESQKTNSFAYLPDIIDQLTQLLELYLNKVNNDKKIKKLRGGLVRLISEDFSFMNSNLGNKLLRIISDL